MDTLIRYRHLPHWDVDGATYFVTSCLEGSVPAKGLLDIRAFQKKLENEPIPADLSEAEWQYRREKMIFGRFDQWLDSEPAVRHLERPELAKHVVDAMNHFADERYDLLAFVVVPSHFHWVFRPLDSWTKTLGDGVKKRPPRERIMHSLKTKTAWECNQSLQREGTFWQEESYDHCVRDDEELYRIIEYVENNPVKAGLVAKAEDWKYSSAAVRKRYGLSFRQSIGKKHLM